MCQNHADARVKANYSLAKFTKFVEKPENTLPFESKPQKTLNMCIETMP
jgi:hypothetical protein